MQSKLNKQVANKELSQKLWELGVRVDGLYFWKQEHIMSSWKWTDTWYLNIGEIERVTKYDEKGVWDGHIFPALTSSELGEMLPEKYKSFKYKGEWLCEYEDDKGYVKVSSDKESEANNRAKMLIYLIEQGLVKVEDINKQLN